MSKETLIKDAIAAIKACDEASGIDVIKQAQGEGIDPMMLLADGFSVGIREVGDGFGRGELFLPELMQAAEMMKTMSNYIDEISSGSEGAEKKGTMVFATVEGDVHDIGKGIVVSILRTQGIDVIDLGRDVAVPTIIAKAEEYKADLIGTSALLTTTMVQQKLLEEALRNHGVRDKYKTMVGGAPVTQRWAKRIGASAYAEDAAEAVNKALELLEA
ncbi:MAG: cobalamin-dependent protein [Bacillota bacterium]|nr:cobalamin-dependent protein [Bacillota bacterium]